MNEENMQKICDELLNVLNMTEGGRSRKISSFTWIPGKDTVQVRYKNGNEKNIYCFGADAYRMIRDIMYQIEL